MMEFATLAPPILALTAIVLLPGWALALALGRRGLRSVTLAPALSLGLWTLTALVVDRLGLRWGVLPLVVVGAVVAAGVLLMRRRVAPLDDPALADDADRWAGPTLLAGAAGSVLAVALWSRHLKNVLMSPDAISQTFDNVFHLNVIRYIAETGDPGPWLARGLDPAASSTIFYPTAWHQLAALALPAAEASVAHASNATLWVVVALFWPLSALELTLALGVRSPGAVASVGVLSASFSAYPFLMMDWGVLYPNLLSYAAIPSLIAALGPRLARGPGGGPLVLPAVAGILLLLGVAVAHPNGALLAFALLLPAILLGIVSAVRDLRRPEARFRAALWCGAAVLTLGLGVLAWNRARPSNRPWAPLMDTASAVGQALLANPIIGQPAWLIAFLTVAGLVTFRAPRHAWFLGTTAIAVALWVVSSSAPEGRVREFLTGIWYSDSYRLGPVLALVALPFAALALERAAAAVGPGRAGWLASRGASLALAVALPLLMVAGTQWSAAVTHAVRHTATAYDAADLVCVAGDVTCLLTQDERALLEALPQLTPPDAVILAEPLNGSTLAYALADRRVLRPYIGLKPTPEEDFLLGHLSTAPADDPQLCQALTATGVTHVLDFGATTVHTGSIEHPGFQGLQRSPVVRVLAQDGQAALYEVTACGRG